MNLYITEVCGKVSTNNLNRVTSKRLIENIGQKGRRILLPTFFFLIFEVHRPNGRTDYFLTRTHTLYGIAIFELVPGPVNPVFEVPECIKLVKIGIE